MSYICLVAVPQGPTPECGADGPEPEAYNMIVWLSPYALTALISKPNDHRPNRIDIGWGPRRRDRFPVPRL